MLKRQRPVTPPPSLSELPSVPDFPMGEPSSFTRDTKRRRTVAPQMDGRERGMNYSDDDNNSYAEEEYDEAAVLDMTKTEDRDEARTGREEQAGQYKNMNQLLHQLHLEHQSRSRFNASSSSTLSTWHQSSHHQNAYLPQSSKQPQRASDSDNMAHAEHTTSLDKADEVWTNYEANNRLLGSIIRHRLHEQGCEDANRR